ncbi:hypothetical protein DIPPA_13559 [Diplonema papillatum]|nr:hypothetical protein DIPPA_13559 [Diplonema papillatum]
MSFIERVAGWYGEGTLQDELEAFLDECGDQVDTAAHEQNHENKLYYDKFTAAIDRALTGFCKEEGITEQEFFAKCEEDSSKCESSNKILSAILNGASYEAFLSLVKDWQQEQKNDPA